MEADTESNSWFLCFTLNELLAVIISVAQRILTVLRKNCGFWNFELLIFIFKDFITKANRFQPSIIPGDSNETTSTLPSTAPSSLPLHSSAISDGGDSLSSFTSNAVFQSQSSYFLDFSLVIHFSLLFFNGTRSHLTKYLHHCTELELSISRVLSV